MNRPVEARAAYREALRLDNNLSQTHANLGQLLQQEGQLNDALPRLKRAVELEPNIAEFRERLAELHGDREAQSSAISCFERVLALAPERVAAHPVVGWALQEEGRLTEARAHFDAAAKLQPNSAAAQLNLGGLRHDADRAGVGPPSARPWGRRAFAGAQVV